MEYIALEKSFEQNIGYRSFYLQKMKIASEKKHYILSFVGLNELNSVYFLYRINDIEKTKNCYYEAAMAYSYWCEKLNRDIFTIPKIFLYPILSDNHALINRYLEYDESEHKKPGTFTYHFGKAVQAVIKDDKEDLAMRIEWLSKRSRSGPMKNMAGSVVFFEGILNNDLEKIKEGITDVQKKLQKHQLAMIKDYMNVEATGLAKLAWRKGFEVDIDSSFIPKAMLPVQELEHYESFDFFDESVVV